MKFIFLLINYNMEITVKFPKFQLHMYVFDNLHNII